MTPIKNDALEAINTFLEIGKPPPNLKSLSDRERNTHIVNVLEDQLKNHEHRKIEELLGPITNHPAIDTAKKFLRKQAKLLPPQIKERLSKRIVAVKVGLSAEDLNHNPGFQQFAEKNVLHRYLLLQGHNLKIDTKTGEILILCDGRYLPWKKAKVRYNIGDDGLFQGKYGLNGLEKEGFHSWKKLKPSYRRNPDEWGKRYVVDICNWTHKPLQILDNHSWLRLKTPKGDVYSVGDWPQDKGLQGSWTKSPLRIKEGRLISPDVSDAYRGQDTVVTFSFAITAKQFRKMKRQIEKDKRQEGRPFHLLHGNCTSYTNRIAALAGVKLPVELETIELLVPNKILRTSRWVRRFLPKKIRQLAAKGDAVAMNLFALALGYHKVDSAIQAKPHFSQFKDLLKCPTIDHPSLSYSIVKDIESWREEKKAPLEAKLEKLQTNKVNLVKKWQKRSLKKKLDNISYQLPSHLRKGA